MSKSHCSTDPHVASLEAKVAALEKLGDERREVVDKAFKAVEDAALRTTKQQNQWRGAVGDLVATRMSRDEYALAHRNLVDKVDAVSSRLDRHEGGSKGVGSSWLVAVQIFMVVGIVCAIITELVLH